MTAGAVSDLDLSCTPRSASDPGERVTGQDQHRHDQAGGEDPAGWFLGSMMGGCPPPTSPGSAGTWSYLRFVTMPVTVPVTMLVQLPPSGATAAASIASLLAVAGAFGLGLASYQRAIGHAVTGAGCSRRGRWGRACRIRPLVASGRDVDQLIGRHEPHVARAVTEGARLIVLPEAAAIVTSRRRERWLGASPDGPGRRTRGSSPDFSTRARERTGPLSPAIRARLRLMGGPIVESMQESRS